MDFRLKLKDGSFVDLKFSMYFLNRACKIAGKSLQEMFGYLLGDVASDTKTVSGGLVDDLEVRAIVLAAGCEAADFANGDYTVKSLVDGFQMLELVEDSLLNPVWGEMYVVIAKSLLAERLPKEPKKKVVPKKKK